MHCLQSRSGIRQASKPLGTDLKVALRDVLAQAAQVVGLAPRSVTHVILSVNNFLAYEEARFSSDHTWER